MAQQLVTEYGLHWHEEADATLLAESLGRAVGKRLGQALDGGQLASLVVSGGSTPAPVLKYLSGIDLDWSRISVTLADERWVPPGHPDSNESLVRNTLLTNNAAAARFVSLYREGLSEDQALRQVSTDLAAMQQPFSVVMLGMGGDGHTASLFPDAPADELGAAMALDNPAMVAFMHPPSVTQARITLTRSCLLNARHRFLHITGDNKRSVLVDALEASGGHTYLAGQAPVVGLLTEKPGQASIYWSP
ncbi:MAG: 6-phosphogluconolactonase [Granulosicoccus sp.]|nr:6-phosphogluconolactonase [Granulosicoccus sp.]